MKRLITPVIVLLAVVLVAAAGYQGFFGAEGVDALLSAVGLRERQAQASAPLTAPPTVPVSRGDVQQTVIAPGQLEGTQESVLTMSVGGQLAELNARPGDVVRQGNVLARLDTSLVENSLQEAQIRRETAQALYARQLAGAELALQTARLNLEQAQAEHPRRLAEAELALTSAQARLSQARLQYPTLTAAAIHLQNAVEVEAEVEVEYQEALERQQANWEPKEVVEGYRRALDAAQDARALAAADYDAVQRSQEANSEALKGQEAEVERANIELARLQAGVDPLLALEGKKAAQNLSDLKAAGVDPLLELAVQRAQADLQAATLLAPFDGTVIEVHARLGATVAPGAELIVLTNPSAAEAVTKVIEEDLPLVGLGQPAELFFDAVPEAAVQGRVTRIVPQRVRGENRPLYPVYISPNKLPAGLLPGMTVDASIIVSQQTDVLRLPRALVRAGSGGTAQVEVWADGQTQKRTVQVGLRGDVYIEILEGLKEGELVVGQ